MSEAVARGLFKVMAYKDEYEVARLFTDGSFAAQVAQRFEGDIRMNYHLAPPLLSKPDPVTGEPRKMVFGPWIKGVFSVLARLKGLRGTAFDVFGYSHERRTERALIAQYEAMIAEFTRSLTRENHAAAVAAASVIQKVRGFGHVKARNLERARGDWDRAMDAFRAPPGAGLKAAE